MIEHIIHCIFFQPERAIEVYEAALKKNPRDFSLASKIGQALVKTHNYGKVKTFEILQFPKKNEGNVMEIAVNSNCQEFKSKLSKFLTEDMKVRELLATKS